MTFKDYYLLVARDTDSFERMDKLVSLHSEMSHQDWLRLIGEYWSVCDTIHEHRLTLRRILGTKGPIRLMMSEEENAAYDALPELVTIYRGCGVTLLGASWSLDRAVANSFPFTNRYRVSDPILITATVKKQNILCVKLDREESEIVTFSAKRQKFEPADPLLAAEYHAAAKADAMQKMDALVASQTEQSIVVPEGMGELPTSVIASVATATLARAGC